MKCCEKTKKKRVLQQLYDQGKTCFRSHSIITKLFIPKHGPITFIEHADGIIACQNQRRNSVHFKTFKRVSYKDQMNKLFLLLILWTTFVFVIMKQTTVSHDGLQNMHCPENTKPN